MDPYEILGVTKETSMKDITRAFHVLAKKYHPDMEVNEEKKRYKEKKFETITQAYNMIKSSNPKKIESSEKIYVNDREQKILHKAKYLISQKDYNSAIRILKDIKGKFSNDAYTLLGEAYLRKERYHDALRYFKKVHDSNAWNLDTKFKMAYIYEKINLKNSAKKIYKEIIAIDSSNAKAFKRLASIDKKKFSLSNLFKKG